MGFTVATRARQPLLVWRKDAYAADIAIHVAAIAHLARVAHLARINLAVATHTRAAVAVTFAAQIVDSTGEWLEVTALAGRRIASAFAAQILIDAEFAPFRAIEPIHSRPAVEGLRVDASRNRTAGFAARRKADVV